MTQHRVDPDTPEAPIWSRRGFVAHVLTVTIGFLIALGLNSLVDIYEQHKTAAQARSYFLTEIAENRGRIAKDLKDGETQTKTFVAVIAYLQKRLAGDHTSLEKFNIRTSSVVLSHAAWDTGLASQALTYMPFEQTGALARLYALQNEFAQVETAALETSYDMSSFGNANAFSDTEIPQTLKTIQKAYAYQTSINQLEHKLLVEYDNTDRLLAD